MGQNDNAVYHCVARARRLIVRRGKARLDTILINLWYP
jgi:hypothetical protein